MDRGLLLRSQEWERLAFSAFKAESLLAGVRYKRDGYENETSNQKLGMPMEKIGKSFPDTDALFEYGYHECAQSRSNRNK